MGMILACTDGSAYAASVYQHAAWAAKRLGVGIEILHVIEHHRERSQGLDLSGAIGFDASAELTEELTRLEEAQGKVALLRGKEMLAEARQQLSGVGITDITLTQRHGSLIETLTEREPQAELVVVGKRGEHGGSSSSPLGENLEHLVRLSIRPVLVASQNFQPISRCLIAFDDSPSARKAVAYAAASALFRALECELIMVGHTDAAHEAALNEARATLTASGLAATVTIARGNPANVIAEHLKQGRHELLVMGAYGHSRIREFFVGSTTAKLVRGSSLPVLLFR